MANLSEEFLRNSESPNTFDCGDFWGGGVTVHWNSSAITENGSYYYFVFIKYFSKLPKVHFTYYLHNLNSNPVKHADIILVLQIDV